MWRDHNYTYHINKTVTHSKMMWKLGPQFWWYTTHTGASRKIKINSGFSVMDNMHMGTEGQPAAFLHVVVHFAPCFLLLGFLPRECKGPLNVYLYIEGNTFIRKNLLFAWSKSGIMNAIFLCSNYLKLPASISGNK